MKVSFHYSRKVVIPTSDTYKPVSYDHGMGIEYSHEETEDQTIIPSLEFKKLEETIDKEQRKIIKEEMGRDVLPHDEMVEKKKIKIKFKKKQLFS